jgi:hypothetical protein
MLKNYTKCTKRCDARGKPLSPLDAALRAPAHAQHGEPVTVSFQFLNKNKQHLGSDEVGYHIVLVLACQCFHFQDVELIFHSRLFFLPRWPSTFRWPLTVKNMSFESSWWALSGGIFILKIHWMSRAVFKVKVQPNTAIGRISAEFCRKGKDCTKGWGRSEC